jgi:transcriptional regulator with GAF, ATPase, and Fis domain
MSKFDLRDISDRLARSRDTEAVVFEFLGYLQQLRHDWRAALAFYEVSHDALVNTYERQGSRLVRRDIRLPVSQLPTRLVRKFFHPSAFFNHTDRRSMIAQLFSGSPYFEPELSDAASMRPVTPMSNWQSCVCLPLADQEDVLALLVVASHKRNAFGSQVVGDLIPVKSMAALALSQHLYRTSRGPAPAANEHAVRAAAADFNDRLHRLTHQTSELEE